MNCAFPQVVRWIFDRLSRSARGVVIISLLALVASSIAPCRAAAPTKLGDLNGDGVLDVFDLTLLRQHIRQILPLAESMRPFADVNGDGFVNEDDAVALIHTIVGASPEKVLLFDSIRETSPFAGEGGVALTREVILRFTMPLSENATLTTFDANTQTPGDFYAEAGGRKLLTRVELSGDRTKATLFFLEPVPASTRVKVTFDGVGINDLLERQIDPAGDNLAASAGIFTFTYDTAPISPVPGTGIIGHVYASEKAPAGGDTPLAGALVRVVGSETLFTFTAADGSFNLTPCPAGRFFVEVDGRPVTGGFPDGAYYPYIVKAWEALPGKLDNLAATTGKIYLPLVPANTLQPVSTTQMTTIAFAPEVVAANPALGGVEIYVPPNSLFADDGTRGGKVGLAPVASDRLPEPLPPGLHHALDISIQTDGATNFDKPVPVKFPNLPDPVTGITLKPGEKSALWSFNHDKGAWEIVGPMTVTDDGNFVVTDIGVGVRQPGWHGAMPGVGVMGPTPPDPPTPPACPDLSTWDYLERITLIIEALAECGELFFTAETKAARIIEDVAKAGRILILAEGYVDTIREGKYYSKTALRTELVSLRLALETLADEIGEDASPFSKVLDCAESILNIFGPLCDNSEKYPDCYSDLAKKLCGYRAAVLAIIAAARLEEAKLADKIAKLPIGQAEGVIDSLLAIIDLANSPNGARSKAAAQSTDDAIGDKLNDLISLIKPLDQIDTSEIDQIKEFVTTEAGIFSVMGDTDYLLHGSHPNSFYLVKYGDTVLRGKTDSSGTFQLRLPANSEFSIYLYEPSTKSYGFSIGVTGTSGSSLAFHGPAVTKLDAFADDSDNDGLPDVAEFIVGTDPNNPDSDFDGVPDGSEVLQGSNPLDDRATATGVISTVKTFGTAQDVVAQNSVALLADASEGVAVFNVAKALNPVRTAQIRLAGSTESVALDGTLAAATGSSLALLDLSDLSAVRVTKQLFLGGTPRAVTAAGGVAYAGLDNGQVVAVDMVAGTELERLQVSIEPIHDLSFAGDVLYARTPSKVYAIELVAAGMNVTGSVAVNGSTNTTRLRLFAGGGFAYAPYTNGYTILALADPLHPAVTQTVSTQQFNWKQVVPTGSGLALAVVGNTGPDGELNLYDFGANGQNSQFLTTFTTPGDSQAISIYNGLAYVADGGAGLTVVNYKAYDTLGVPPTISISTGFPTVNDALQAEEGKLGRVTAAVTDDVQVRNVEFYVDGQLAVTDGNFPFEHRFTTPLKAQVGFTKASFTLRAKATDTGGNTAWSDTLTVTLVADATPPRVVKFLPPNGSFTGSLRAVAATFSEPIDQDTLNATTFSLTGAGPDGVFGTPDDFTPAGGAISYRDATNTAFISFAQDLVPSLYRLVVSPPLSDLAGNPIAAPAQTLVRVFSFQDSDGDGIPDDVEPLFGLDPHNPDTDGNGIRDGDEDYDHDGLTNAQEIALGLDPRNPHSNGDPNVLDGDADPDHDGLNNRREALAGTDPNNPDTDGDGWNDEAEIAGGSNPLDPRNHPIGFIASAPVISIVRVGDATNGLLSKSSVVAQPAVFIARTAFDPIGPNGGLGSAAFIATPTVFVARYDQTDSSNWLGGAIQAQPSVILSRPMPVNISGGRGSFIAAPVVNLLRLDGLGPFLTQPPVFIEIQNP